MTTNNASLARENNAALAARIEGAHFTPHGRIQAITAALDAKDKAMAEVVSDDELRKIAFVYAEEREKTIPEWVCKTSTRRTLIEAGFKAGYRAALAKLRGDDV